MISAKKFHYIFPGLFFKDNVLKRIHNDSSTLLLWHLPYLEMGRLFDTFLPFDLEMNLSYIPIL